MADNGASSYHRFLQGDREALNELVRQYSDELVRYAYLYVKNADVAEDIMEETFAALIVKKRTFRGESFFRAYLYAIARNKAIDTLRRKRNSDVPFDDLENVLQTEGGVSAFENRERDKTVYRCMQSLPDDYRDVLYFTYFEELSVEAVRKIMKKSRKQIYNLLFRAKSSLKEILEKEGIGYEDL